MGKFDPFTDVMTDAVEGEIVDDASPKNTVSAELAEDKQVGVAESDPDEVKELESLGELQEAKNEAGPKKAEQNVDEGE